MPNCPNCGTWNPDDKMVCWRCQNELPRPVAKKPRKPNQFLGLSLWLWLAIAFFVVMIASGQCLVQRIAG